MTDWEAKGKVDRVGNAIREHLAEITELFVPGMKLTFFARCPGRKNSDMLITEDEPEQIIAGIRALADSQADSGKGEK